MEKETPYFDYELKKWLVLYSIGNGPHRFTDLKEKMQKILRQEIISLNLHNIISDLQSRDCVKIIERKDPVYKNEGKILKYLGNNVEKHYFLTKKGKEQLLFNWRFAASAIPKESYEEIFKNICAISQS